MHAAWFLVMSAGCLPATMPRGGRVADTGDLRIGLAFTGTLGVGTVRTLVDGVEHRDHGNSALFAIGQGDVGPPLVSIDVQLGVGVGAGCEVGALLGVLKLGPEVRCQVVASEPTPIAVAAGAYWKLTTGAEVAVGVDSGVRFPVDLYVSYGEQRHAMVLDDGGSASQAAVVVMWRRELRVTGAVAATLRPDETSQFVLGISPYLTLAASPPDELRCEHCGDHTIARALDESYGVGFALGTAMP